MESNWAKLDEQVRRYSPSLRDDLRILPPWSNALATQIAAEITQLPSDILDAIRNDDLVSTRDRLDELTAFQGFMDTVHAAQPQPMLTRAQVIVQNYVCFVYLGDVLFKQLRKRSPQGSATRKCSQFLTDNPVRAFRNAVAHGNWAYRTDFSALVFWARKGSDQNEPMTRFEVGQTDLSFWQSLARCVAYVAYTQIEEDRR